MRGRGDKHGKDWTSVAIDRRIEGLEEGFVVVSFILLSLPLVSLVELESWSIVGLVSVRENRREVPLFELCIGDLSFVLL